LESILAFLHHFLGADLKSAFFVILNLILIESLLSIDNAAVLATMVMDLPESERKKALRIGIVFAYIFRGACLVFASVLIQITWLKLLGGLYLIYLTLHYFYKLFFKHEHIVAQEQEELGEATQHPKKKFGFLTPFWSTVLMVELMDLTFSIDNVFAAVAFTSNIYLVILGVFIGIIAMRVVAGYFVKLMERFPFLDSIAFVVIGLLGIKLCLSFLVPYFPNSEIALLLESEQTDLYFSILTVSIFVLPILSSVFLNFPKRR